MRKINNGDPLFQKSTNLNRRSILKTLGVGASALVSGCTGNTNKEPMWSFDTDGNKFDSSPTVVNNNIYIYSNISQEDDPDDGSESEYKLYALDKNTGAQRWSIGTNYTPFEPRIKGGYIYTETNQSKLAKVDTSTGEIESILHSVEFGESYQHYTLHDDKLYFTTEVLDSNARIYAIDLNNEDTLWNKELPRENVSEVVAANNTLYLSVSSYDSDDQLPSNVVIKALNAQTGEENWKFYSEYYAETPQPYGNNVYIGGDKLYSVDMDTGVGNWVRDLGVDCIPTIHNETIYLNHYNGYLLAINTNSGEPRWIHEYDKWGFTGPDISPTIAGNTIFSAYNQSKYDEDVNNPSGYFVAFDKSNGNRKWKFKSESQIQTSPTVSDGVVYFAAGDKLHALETGVSGSSIGSRVRLATLGHTDAFAEREVKNTNPDTSSTSTIHPKIDYTPEEPEIGDQITLDASKTSIENGTITSYEWDIGDDGSIDYSGVSFTTTLDPNTRTVSLTVTTDDGRSSTVTTPINFASSQINISVTASDTQINVNENTIITYSVTNFVTSDDMTIQMLIETPSDVNIKSVQGAEEGSNQFTAVTTLPPGSQEDIRIGLTPTAPGSYTIRAIADYYFDDDRKNTQRKIQSILIEAQKKSQNGGSKDSELSDIL